MGPDRCSCGSCIVLSEQLIEFRIDVVSKRYAVFVKQHLRVVNAIVVMDESSGIFATECVIQRTNISFVLHTIKGLVDVEVFHDGKGTGHGVASFVNRSNALGGHGNPPEAASAP